MFGKDPPAEPLEGADMLEFARLWKQSIVHVAHILIFIPIDNWMRRKRALTGPGFNLMGYSCVNVHCPNGVAIRALTSFPEQNFELYILANSPSRYEEGFIPHFDRPIHIFPNSGKHRFSAIYNAPN